MNRTLRMLVLGLALAALVVAVPTAQAGIKVYVDKEYKGESIQIDAAVPDLRKLDFDDRISSLQADETWLVCSAPRFKGDCREVEGGLVNLRQEGLNDRITSLKPVKHKGKGKRAPRETREEGERSAAEAPPARRASSSTEWWGDAPSAAAFRPSAGQTARRAGIRVFAERDFAGSSRRFSGPVANLQWSPAPPVIRSVILENGSWEICTRPAFEGDCRILRDSTEDLDDWADRVASLRPTDEG